MAAGATDAPAEDSTAEAAPDASADGTPAPMTVEEAKALIAQVTQLEEDLAAATEGEDFMKVRAVYPVSNAFISGASHFNATVTLQLRLFWLFFVPEQQQKHCERSK